MTPHQFARLSRQIGKMIPWWIQGPGGNFSYKNKNTLIIKASGVRVENLTAENGLVNVSLPHLKRKLSQIKGSHTKAEQAYTEALRICSKPHPLQKRPSMEAGLHVFLPQKYVFHFHSLPALLMAYEHRKNPRKVNQWLKKKWLGSFAVLPSIRPGLILTQKVRSFKKANLILLENHGVILHSQKTAILNQWKNCERKFCRDFKYQIVIKKDRMRSTPIRFYFPDSAVFEKRLKGILRFTKRKKGESFYRLKKNSLTRDKDATEIWMATEALYHSCPPLPQLARHVKKTVTTLPTERYRQKVSHGS